MKRMVRMTERELFAFGALNAALAMAVGFIIGCAL